jgi:dTDP-4-dehydrorhamnose 3,5-epimerase
MKVIKTDLPEVLIIEPSVFRDNRGYLVEAYHSLRYSEHGFARVFVQDNLSFSARGVLRGLHYQLGQPQAKLVMVLSGEIFDVAVDIRKGSPTFGRWVGVTLSSENQHQIFIPEGFAHGFQVISETATVYYKCTDFYAPREERGLRWDDPALKIDWVGERPVLSEKDRGHPTLDRMSPEQLPEYRSNQPSPI